jgi:hypothetical protein
MNDTIATLGPAQMSSSFGSFEIPEGVIPKSDDGGGVGTTVSVSFLIGPF